MAKEMYILPWEGKQLVFLNVYCVPLMGQYLFSISQIMKQIPLLHVIFSDHKCYMVDKDNKKTIFLGIEDHRLFRLVDIEEAKENALLAKSVQETNMLWHQRYRNLNLDYLFHMAKEWLVDGLPEIHQKKQGICGACQVGKQHGASFYEV
jgi:hypothetical protein